jgi:hypothetical protein
VDGGSSINVTFPKTLKAQGILTADLIQSDTPFFGIIRTEGLFLLGHLFMSVTFDAPDNYWTKFLRFEIAQFECGYNTIIERSGLDKFMAIPHYPYMILKMLRPQGVVTIRAYF